MKRFQSVLCASLLTLAISSTAFAGIITGSRTEGTGIITGSDTGIITGSGTGTGSSDPTITDPKAKADISSGLDFPDYFFFVWATMGF